MAVVARTYRGALRDLEHHGRIVVADAAGNVLYHYGDPYAITFARSAAKPMQAIAVCESGALEAYGCLLYTSELLHAKLVRTTTCVDGCRCDYTICGDHDPYVKEHPEYRDEAGFRRNR